MHIFQLSFHFCKPPLPVGKWNCGCVIEWPSPGTTTTATYILYWILFRVVVGDPVSSSSFGDPRQRWIEDPVVEEEEEEEEEVSYSSSSSIHPPISIRLMMFRSSLPPSLASVARWCRPMPTWYDSDKEGDKE